MIAPRKSKDYIICSTILFLMVGLGNPNMGVAKNSGTRFIRENPIKMDDLGVPLFFFWKHPYIDGSSKRPATLFHQDGLPSAFPRMSRRFCG